MPSWSRIDRRTAGARDAIRWRDETVAALGGEDHVSPQRAALIDLATRTRCYVDRLDADLLGRESLADSETASLLAVRSRLTYLFSQLVGQIGLERVPKPVPSLAEYLAERQQAAAPDREDDNERDSSAP